MSSSLRVNTGKICFTLCLITLLAFVGFQKAKIPGNLTLLRRSSKQHSNSIRSSSVSCDESTLVPQALLSLGVYTQNDLRNEAGVAPAFWGCASNSSGDATSSSSSPAKVNGPCYVPTPPSRVDWALKVTLNGKKTPRYHNSSISAASDAPNLAGYCRPGFIIIGVGKGGTSSLYHYLTSHPRVLPAKEKQIHYFKYFTSYPLKWYYNHFPTATNFLASGALMTGEASPGYMPYPDVAHRIRTRLPGPRIIVLGRDPLERSYSSYRYNYVAPTMYEMRSGQLRDRIRPNQTDDYYQPYLFTFEEMIRAELANLRDCLSSGGRAEIGTQKQYGKSAWVQTEMSRRKELGLPPIVDLIGQCYGKSANRTAIRAQWTEMIAANPEKIITPSNTHLKESIIGRSLYVLQLDWWYALYPREDLYFVCTEELSDLSGEPVGQVAQFLGLPRYNFSSIVQGGSYNVGGHRGYDKETPWEEFHKTDSIRGAKGAIPEELRQELLQFFEPFNERLFNLTGRRCDWH